MSNDDRATLVIPLLDGIGPMLSNDLLQIVQLAQALLVAGIPAQELLRRLHGYRPEETSE